jgi:hypothetical protein
MHINAVADIVANGGTILFVGTKKQAQDAIKTEAERCGMYYVNERWLRRYADQLQDYSEPYQQTERDRGHGRGRNF